MVRDFSNDPIAEYEKQDTKALVCVRTFNDIPLLVIKFAFRNNIRNGCILKRPRIIQDLNKSMTRAWCRVHAGWPYIQKRVKPGNLISPSFTRANINRILKKTMTLAGFDSGGLYSPHAFRRGATQEILASGSTLSVVLTSGTWAAAGYRYYLDTQLDEALNITRIVLEQANSDSPDEDMPPDITEIRKKLRLIPAEFASKKPKPSKTR